MSRKSLTDEEARILYAARRGALRINHGGRYVIDGEDRPDRRARERMVNRGYIGWTIAAGTTVLTGHGRAALVRYEAERGGVS